MTYVQITLIGMLQWRWPAKRRSIRQLHAFRYAVGIPQVRSSYQLAISILRKKIHLKQSPVLHLNLSPVFTGKLIFNFLVSSFR